MLDKQFYLKNGLIYGGINAVYLLITYVMGVDTMMSYYNMGFSLLLGLGLMIFMGTQVRKALGGFMTLGEGFKNIMIIYAFASFIYLVVNHVLGTVIDPELPLKMAEATIEKSMALMEGFMPEEALDEVYENMGEVREDVLAMYTLTGFIKTYVQTLAVGAIGVVIGAAITKKVNPNPFPEDLHE